MFRLDNKIAAVTGAGSGIGQAIARTFAAQGARVFALDLDDAAASATAESIRDAGGKADAIACDVSNTQSVASAVERVASEAGRIDILVNNAGIAHIGTVESTRRPISSASSR